MALHDLLVALEQLIHKAAEVRHHDFLPQLCCSLRLALAPPTLYTFNGTKLARQVIRRVFAAKGISHQDAGDNLSAKPQNNLALAAQAGSGRRRARCSSRCSSRA